MKTIKPKKVTLLTHLSLDANNTYFIDSPISLTPVTKFPKNRISGVFGRQAALKALKIWWHKFDAIYGVPLSKVELSVDDCGEKSNNQRVEDLDSMEILNIPMAQDCLTNLLNNWAADFSPVEKKHLGDREFFRRVAGNPEIINRLFDRPELAHIKAIVWPSADPDNNSAYLKIITFRSINDTSSVRLFNSEEISCDVQYAKNLYLQ